MKKFDQKEGKGVREREFSRNFGQCEIWANYSAYLEAQQESGGKITEEECEQRMHELYPLHVERIVELDKWSDPLSADESKRERSKSNMLERARNTRKFFKRRILKHFIQVKNSRFIDGESVGNLSY